jgi:polysaccharide biosynthesis protein PelD
MPGAQAMLDFIVQQCRVDSAAIYAVRRQPHLELTQVATAGGMEAVGADDPIIVHALETGHSVHLQDALMALSKRKQIIAVTPMISTQGEPFGLLAIGSMPFTSLNNENLQTIAVLLESYADYLRLTVQANEILADWPNAPRSLAGEFAWLNRLRLNFGQPSRCAVWRIQHAREQEMLNHLNELHSRGETAWRWPVGRVEAQSKPCVIALVPFTDEAGMRVYTQRIFDAMAKSFPDLNAEQLDVQDFALGQADSFAYLRSVAEGLNR